MPRWFFSRQVVVLTVNLCLPSGPAGTTAPDGWQDVGARPGTVAVNFVQSAKLGG